MGVVSKINVVMVEYWSMEDKYRKLAHATYDCRYHIVFVPKYRYRVLDDEKIIKATQMIYPLGSVIITKL